MDFCNRVLLEDVSDPGLVSHQSIPRQAGEDSKILMGASQPVNIG